VVNNTETLKKLSTETGRQGGDTTPEA